MAARNGFFAALFDFSFAELVTTRLARGLYALAVGGAGLVSVAIVVYGLSRSLWVGILASVVAAVLLLFAVVLVRVWLEAAVVLTRIADQTEEIAEQVAGIAVDATGIGGGPQAAIGRPRM